MISVIGEHKDMKFTGSSLKVKISERFNDGGMTEKIAGYKKEMSVGKILVCATTDRATQVINTVNLCYKEKTSNETKLSGPFPQKELQV